MSAAGTLTGSHWASELRFTSIPGPLLTARESAMTWLDAAPRSPQAPWVKAQQLQNPPSCFWKVPWLEPTVREGSSIAPSCSGLSVTTEMEDQLRGECRPPLDDLLLWRQELEGQEARRANGTQVCYVEACLADSHTNQVEVVKKLEAFLSK